MAHIWDPVANRGKTTYKKKQHQQQNKATKWKTSGTSNWRLYDLLKVLIAKSLLMLTKGDCSNALQSDSSTRPNDYHYHHYSHCWSTYASLCGQILNGHATADIKMLLYWCINLLQQSSYQYTVGASQQSVSKWHSCHSQHSRVPPLTPCSWLLGLSVGCLLDIYCSPLIIDDNAIGTVDGDKCNSLLEMLPKCKRCPVIGNRGGEILVTPKKCVCLQPNTVRETEKKTTTENGFHLNTELYYYSQVSVCRLAWQLVVVFPHILYCHYIFRGSHFVQYIIKDHL